MIRVDRQPGLVLHRRAFRESSLLIELFTPAHGRVGLVARGARGPRSPLRGHTEPFQLLEASWSRRGEMGTLTGLEPAASPISLAGRGLWCGLYANELLLRLLPRDAPEPKLFDSYRTLLERLPDASGQAPALRRFELDLLHALGVAPDLEHEAGSDRPVRPDQAYRLDPATGPEPAPARDPQGVPGRVLLALARGEALGGAEAAAGRRLLRRLIEFQLDGRPLHTPALFRGG